MKQILLILALALVIFTSACAESTTAPNSNRGNASKPVSSNSANVAMNSAAPPAPTASTQPTIVNPPYSPPPVDTPEVRGTTYRNSPTPKP